MKIRPLLIFIVLAVVTLSACSKFSKVLKSKDYDYKLRMAEQYYTKKKYRYAQTLYEELFPILKGTPQFEDLYYKYAYCSYYLRDYVNAENLFKGFLDVFPNSPKSEEVDYMHAYCFYRQSPKAELDQTNTTKTMGMMQTFINTHPGSARNKEAAEIIDKCLLKLETKDFMSAQLYFNMGQYRAAAIAFSTLSNNFPDSPKADEYKLMVIRSYYRYASLSIPEKQAERYEKVVNEVHDFQDRYPESKLLKEAERFLTLSQNNIKAIIK
ncbi:MAG: outer membrane protein assembly factor BamD [Chitinophagaceae bacterium]|nr:outer membrane protein assembly factor BamD [Chitinophagaceae bacterium]